MSLGASPSDIAAVVTFCKALYRRCEAAAGDHSYEEIAREVRDLHTALRHLRYEIEAADSPLNRDRDHGAAWSRQLAPIVADCDITLRQLDRLIMGRKLADGTGPSGGNARSECDEMDELGAIRVKLIREKTSLTAFLDSVQ